MNVVPVLAPSDSNTEQVWPCSTILSRYLVCRSLAKRQSLPSFFIALVVRVDRMGLFERLAEETERARGIRLDAEQEVDRLPAPIDGTVQVGPPARQEPVVWRKCGRTRLSNSGV